MKCRHCHAPVTLPFVDLGSSPPSNAYLTPAQMQAPETVYPLRVLVCEQCWLVQTEDFAGFDDMFSAEYAYFSSFSSSWMQHATAYSEAMTKRFGLNTNSCVVEVASNDGYLLRNFKAAGIPCYGIEPTASTAKAARDIGIESIEEFFGQTLAQQLLTQGRQADLTAANNVLAHVPDINDFVAGFAILLKPQGVSTFEFPHLMNLVKFAQFDTIYHEHFSYLSLTAVKTIFKANGLTVFDVEELPTHGGSLRVYAQRSDTGQHAISPRVADMLKREDDVGMRTAAYYGKTQADAVRIKRDLWRFLLQAQEEGKTVAAYGAAAKGNTLLNYAGVRDDLVKFVIDLNPAKQNKFMPGSRIPMVGPDVLNTVKPDYMLILPWNLEKEIKAQLAAKHNVTWQYVIAVPELKIS
ncbi:MAG: class I SAM-dependent methyltransferase [Polaromonas sp.]|jgi:2-polyprenyl-3-methyl-5-hydroxy-6-metoxy-1,4-benzoquinol methylase|nr:class I SAM-dependent methyltransferase [Polaromonas sp.]MBP7308961.1 class I SAM-dependent methyltransferase [Polaromonas sp.]MBP8874132.1 class I SAM-dependent methyltransferase [Polaromonas sp.]MBP9831388.1 class I SAM-dependent methyltransferase [Polaromonas sp.]